MDYLVLVERPYTEVYVGGRRADGTAAPSSVGPDT